MTDATDQARHYRKLYEDVRHAHGFGSTPGLAEREGLVAEFGSDPQREALRDRLGRAAEGLGGLDTSSVDPDTAESVRAAASALRDAARAVEAGSATAGDAIFGAEQALADMNRRITQGWDRPRPRPAAAAEAQPTPDTASLARALLGATMGLAGLAGLVLGPLVLADDGGTTEAPPSDPAVAETTGTGTAALDPPPPPQGVQVEDATGEVEVELRRVDGRVELTGEAELQGGLTIDDPPCQVEGVSRHEIVADVDPQTGAVTGTSTHASTQEAIDPQSSQCDQLSGSQTAEEPVTGQVDPDTGDVTLEATGAPIDGVEPTTTFEASVSRSGVDAVLNGAEASSSDGSDDDGALGTGLTLGGMTLLAAGTATLVRSRRTPSGEGCEHLRLAWEKAQAECDARAAEARTSRRRCDEAVADRDQLARDRDALCAEWPPACWDDAPEDTFVEDAEAPESREDLWDLFVRDQYARDRWAAYQAGEISAEEAGRARDELPPPEAAEDIRRRHDAARSRRDRLDEDLARARETQEEACAAADEAAKRAEDACAAADEARRRYEECVAQARKDEATPAAATPGTGARGPGGDGSQPGDAPGADGRPREGDPCQEGEQREDVVLAELRDDVLIDASVRIVHEGGRALEPYEGKRISEGFDQISGVAGALGRAWTLRGLGKGLIEGATGATAAKAGAATVGVPTSLPSLAAKYVSYSAGAIADITESVTRWASTQNTYTLFLVRYFRTVHVRQIERWVCEEGTWRCRRDIEVEYGELRPTQNRVRTGITGAELGAEVRSWLTKYKFIAGQEFAEVEGWIAEHPPGGCG